MTRILCFFLAALVACLACSAPVVIYLSSLKPRLFVDPDNDWHIILNGHFGRVALSCGWGYLLYSATIKGNDQYSSAYVFLATLILIVTTPFVVGIYKKYKETEHPNRLMAKAFTILVVLGVYPGRSLRTSDQLVSRDDLPR